MPDTDPRLLEALASLNQIGAAMNQLGSDETVSVESTLALIVESASRLVPDASAVIYSFDPARGEFVEPALQLEHVALPQALHLQAPMKSGTSDIRHS